MEIKHANNIREWLNEIEKIDNEIIFIEKLANKIMFEDASIKIELSVNKNKRKEDTDIPKYNPYLIPPPLMMGDFSIS